MLDQQVKSWTVSDAAELYEVGRWGAGYFSVDQQGHLHVHPTKDPQRSIDLKQLIDSAVARHRPADPDPLRRHPQAPAGRDPRRLPAGDEGASIQGQLLLRLSDQGQPAAAGRRGGAELRPAVSLRARGRSASPSCWPWWPWPSNDTPIICNGFKDAEFIEMAMLAQKIGRRVIPVVEKYTELGLILEYAAKVGVRPQIGMRVKLAAQGRRPLARLGRISLEVRTHGHRNPARAGRAEAARHGGLLQAAALPPRQPDPQHSPHQAGAERSRARLRRAGPAAARAWNISTSAAAWASTTTARRPISNRASTTRCRSTPTTSSTTSRASATTRACRIPRSSPKAAGPSSPTTVRWCSTCWACRAWARATCPASRRPRAEQPIVDLLRRHEQSDGPQPARKLPRRAAGAGHGHEPVQRRLPAARAAEPGREPVLGHLPQDAAARRGSWISCPRICKGLDAMLTETYFCNFSLFQSMPDSWAIKQLFPVMPIHRLERAADAPRRAGRHHVRLGRQDRAVHRSPRRQADAAAAHASTASRTTSAPSCWAPTRKSWATCTTCSATPTPCTSAWTTTAKSCWRPSSRGTRSARCSTTSSSTSTT